MLSFLCVLSTKLAFIFNCYLGQTESVQLYGTLILVWFLVSFSIYFSPHFKFKCIVSWKLVSRHRATFIHRIEEVHSLCLRKGVEELGYCNEILARNGNDTLEIYAAESCIYQRYS